MDLNGRQVKGRSRNGCWTCRSRKKKCSGVNFPCQQCTRLGLICDFQPRLIWETDERRPGIRSRGPKKGTKRRTTTENKPPRLLSLPGVDSTPDDPSGRSTEDNCPLSISETEMFAWNIGWHQHFSDFPGLDAMEFHLLEHYIHRFSRTYPAFPGPDNSFLSVFVPLAAKSSLVLHSLLALSGIQGLDQSNVEVKAKTLRIRQRALVGCRQLVTRSASVSSHRPLDNMSEDDLLYLLASCMLLLLYEKLTGEGQANWQPHFQFIREVVACYQSRFMKPSSSRMTGTFCFLHSLFAYHDLLRAMQLRTKVFSTFYENSGERDSKFYYPRLMVRICAADVTVTEADIYSWDGNMSWLPSFPLGRSIDCHSRISGTAGDNSSDWLRRDETRSLIHTGSKKVDNLSMLSDLYRITAFLLHKQIWDAQHLESGNPRSLMACDVQNQLLQRSELAAQGISLIQELLQGLSFKSTLLWPIGIIMRDLIPEQVAERECLIACLDSLSEYFHMKHFTCLRASLELSWSQAAHGQGRSDQSVGFNTSTTGDTMLLG